ncbi:MAG: putative membrane protein SpoIIM required for sporulation [Arenicella sp.]
MKQLEFERRHSTFWDTMESSLQRGSTLEPERLSNFPKDYRRLCQHLAMAKSRRYAAGLITRLNGLVQQGYETLYGQTLNNKTTIIEFLIYGFPASLRANARFLWIAAIVFVLPYVAIMIACMVNDQMIYSVIDAGSVRMAESMYDPGLGKLGRERQSDSDIQMFGFYIYNNIGIAFKSFATGIFLGVGSLFVLAFNGLYIGAISGHLTALGYTETFYPFVIGHGSFELTAIVFSGAAGLKLGFSILAPGAHTRTRALQNAAKDAIKIMYGVFVMLLIAAFIEAFWSSSSTLPNAVKYSVGACLWVFVYYYCFFFAANRVATYRSQDAA